ncbi:unnamed protein product [Closterium sp. Naga37s-1]|nr:unnamed protein product [Closterium sp. Naga37s-1]
MQRGGMATMDSKPIRSKLEGEVAYLQRILVEQREEKELEIQALRETLNQIVTRHAEELQAVNSQWEGLVGTLRDDGDGELPGGGAHTAHIKDQAMFSKKLAARAAAAALAIDRMTPTLDSDAVYRVGLAGAVRCPHCGCDITDTVRDADEPERCTSSDEREGRKGRSGEVSCMDDAAAGLSSVDAPPAALATRAMSLVSLCDFGWSSTSVGKDLPEGVRLTAGGRCADGARQANEAWLLELFVSQVHRVAECMEAYCGNVSRRLSRQGYRTDHLVLEMVGGKSAHHADEGSGAGSDAESCHNYQHSRRRGRHRSECASLLDCVLNIASCVLFTDFEAEDFVRAGFSRLLSNDERCAVKLAKFLALKEKDRAGSFDANREAKFAHFCSRRLEELGEWLQAAALAGGRELPDERMSTALLGDEGDEFAAASSDFVSLCRAVLGLHEAAWSFGCPLRISRIPPNVPFDPALMRPYTWTEPTGLPGEPSAGATAGFSIFGTASESALKSGLTNSAKNGGGGSSGIASDIPSLVPRFGTWERAVYAAASCVHAIECFIDAPLLEVEDGPQPMSAIGGDLRHDGASLRHEGLALEKNAEARSLVAVRNALEELEAHLESLQDVSPAERELALMAVEAKRQELLQHLLAHQGREWQVRGELGVCGETQARSRGDAAGVAQRSADLPSPSLPLPPPLPLLPPRGDRKQVVQELLGFIGDTSAPRTDLSLPPYTHPTAPGPLPPLYHTFHHQQLQNHPPASLATPLPAPRRPAHDPPQQQTTPQAKAVAQQQQGRRAEARAHSQHQIPEQQQQQQQRRGQQSQHGPADSSSSMSSSRLLGAQFGTASSTSSPAHDDGEVDQAHGKGAMRPGQARGGKLAHMQQGSDGGDAGRQVRSMVSGEEGWWSEGTGHGATCAGCMRGDASGSEREEQSWGSEGVGVRGGGSVSWQGTHGDDSSTACMCCSAAAAAGGGGRSSGLTSNTSPYMSTAAGRPRRSAAAAMAAPTSRPSATPPGPTALLGSLVQRVLLPSCQRAAGAIWGGFRMVLGRGGGVGAQVAMVTVGVCVGVGVTLAARNHLPLPHSRKQQQRHHKKQHSKQHSLPAASASKPVTAAAPAAALSAATTKTNPSPPRLSDVSPAAAAAVAAAAAAAAAAATQRVGGVVAADKGSGEGGVGQGMGGGAGSKSGGGSGVMVPSVVVSREAVVPPCDAFPATNPASNLPASTAPATPSASSTSPRSQRQPLDALGAAEAAVSQLETSLTPIVDRCSSRALAADLAPMDRAKAHLVTAHAAASLFCLVLRSYGMAPSEHGVAKDMARIDSYVHKVRLADTAGGAGDGAVGAPTSSLNVAAANRFIVHAIPDLTPEQRRLVREAGKKRRPRGGDGGGEGAGGEGEEGGVGGGEAERAGKKVKSVRQAAEDFLAMAAADVATEEGEER